MKTRQKFREVRSERFLVASVDLFLALAPVPTAFPQRNQMSIFEDAHEDAHLGIFGLDHEKSKGALKMLIEHDVC